MGNDRDYRKQVGINYHPMTAAQARMSLHMSKCHIVGNLMHWLIWLGPGTPILMKMPNHLSTVKWQHNVVPYFCTFT